MKKYIVTLTKEEREVLGNLMPCFCLIAIRGSIR